MNDVARSTDDGTELVPTGEGANGSKPNLSMESLGRAFDTKDRSNEGIEVEVRNAMGESSGIFITVLGQDSDTYQKLSEQQQRQRLKKLSRFGRAAESMLLDDARAQEMDLMVACTVKWRHASGEDMPFVLGANEETKKFYKAYPLVYEQVRIGVLDRANFTRMLVSG